MVTIFLFSICSLESTTVYCKQPLVLMKFDIRIDCKVRMNVNVVAFWRAFCVFLSYSIVVAFQF